MKKFSGWLLLGVGLAFAGWCALALRKDLAQLSLAPLLHSWDLLMIAAVLSLTNYALRILRWRSYLKSLGHPLGLRFCALTYTAGFAYTLSPAKIGEMVRARYYLPLGIPLQEVTAAFFAERLLDLMAMVVIAAVLLTASARYQSSIFLAAALIGCVLVSLAVVPWSRVVERLKSLTRLRRFWRSALVNLASALASTRPFLRPGALAAGFSVGLLAWALEGIGLSVLCSVFPGVHIAVPTAMGIYGVAVLVGGLSFMPGGLGGTEAVMTALLAASGYPVSQALMITLLCRLVTLWLAVFLGWLAVLILRSQRLSVALPWR